MDYKRISSTETSSVILSLTKKVLKVNKRCQKCLNELKQKGMV